MRKITLVREPKIIPLAHMAFMEGSLSSLYAWIGKTHPECYPNGYAECESRAVAESELFPHGGYEGPESIRKITDNELLPELMGRLCYYSFGAKAGTPTNKAYIANTQKGPLPHRSLMYHPKMTFFLSGISRRLTHELIRHYVGADRSEEGSPSQESTRYVEHPGWFVPHPYLLQHVSGTGIGSALENWRSSMQRVYDDYLDFIDLESHALGNSRMSGMTRKRVYEAASSYLPHSAMTSLGWTTNPAALQKLFNERTDFAADLEFQRLALQWQALCQQEWPNLF